MKIWIVTLFPHYFDSFTTSILKRAEIKNKVQYYIVDLRNFGVGKHQKTDDRPFGGGPGMVMMIEPFAKAVDFIKKQIKGSSRVILTSPRGQTFSDSKAKKLSNIDNLIFLCGHYEGVDERVSQILADEEISIGDYVLTGGEPAVLVMVDAIVRLIPQVLGNESSKILESHSQDNLLGFDQYTRPYDYQGHKVPEVLLSGNHQEVADWRQKNRKLASEKSSTGVRKSAKK